MHSKRVSALTRRIQEYEVPDGAEAGIPCAEGIIDAAKGRPPIDEKAQTVGRV